MNMLNVVLVPLRETQIDRTMLFDLYKRSFFAFVDQSFGWDEAFQQTRFHVNYPDEAIFIVLADGQFAGYISRKFREDSLHLALIMLEPAYQRQGIGGKIMQMVTHEASASNNRVTLSCFLGNTRALRFYRELGFLIVSEEPWFANLERGMNNLGLITDIWFNEESGVVQKAGSHVVIRAPNAPEYFSGNMLVIVKRPSIDELPQLESDFARLIGVPPLIGHRSFTWDETSESHVDLDAFVECGYDATIFRVWAATPDSIRPVKSHESVNVRTFDNESDWDVWMRMQLDDMPDPSDTVSIRCIAYQRAMYKNLIDRGLGNWWGAFIGDEQVGSLGLFFQGRTGRFQSVITSDAHRNRGICKTLVSSVLGETSDRVDRWIMVADESSHAGAIYERLGFMRQGRIGNVCKVPA